MKPLKLDDLCLSLEDVMKKWPATITVFAHHKMLCIGCMIGPFHTIEDACAAYGIDEGAFYTELAESIKSNS